jgi:translation elongation factor EF-Tu-like GTPase
MSITKRIKVSINWLRPEEGGRSAIFPGHHYRPTIIIPKHDTVGHWSFFVDFYSLPEYDQPTLAEGNFVMVDFSEDVPWSLMNVGTEFWVMEGSKKVGYGIVIEECREIDVRNLPSYAGKVWD